MGKLFSGHLHMFEIGTFIDIGLWICILEVLFEDGLKKIGKSDRKCEMRNSLPECLFVDVPGSKLTV